MQFNQDNITSAAATKQTKQTEQKLQVPRM